MKTEKNNKPNPENMQELSLEEMEDVTGGGIKEIVAATTLAAMAMTGNTVSAFGLANALAEDAAHIEQAPAQEAYGTEYMGEMASEIEIGDVDAEVGEYSDALGEVDADFEAAQLAAQQELPEAEIPMDAEIPEAEALPEVEAVSQVETAPEVETVAEEQPPMEEPSEGEAVAIATDDAPTAEAGIDAIAEEATEDIAEKTPAEEGPEAPIEETPAEEATEAQPEAVTEAIVEVVDIPANAVEDVDAAAEAVVEAVDVDFGESSIEEEAFEEVEADFIGEDAPVMLEEDAEDKDALMAAMIETAVDARRDEGLYAALDTAFATLAENADALANPRTGVIDTDGNRIVNLTYDALASRFDNTPEQLMGAIGAAAMRADEAGYIQRLGGDPALVGLAASESDNDNAYVMKYGKSYFDAMMNAIALACPEFKPFVPFLTALSGDIFSTGGNPNAAVLKKLDAIEAQIQQSEAAIKRDTYNVVSLQAIGDKYSLVADKAEHIQERIGNIVGNGALTDAQKLQNVADLMNNGEFEALESAMDSATRCFTSNVNDIFERQSLFDAAYARACSTVMFSGEAIDISMPYIARQFAVYCAAYGVMNQVYNAYEQVYGASSLTATRGKMTERLGGTDLQGKRVGGSVASAIKSYFEGDRYIFVNRGSANIALDRGIVVWKIENKAWGVNRNGINADTGAIPLTGQQVEALCSYAGQRHRSPWDFLFNDMHFAPVMSSKKKLGSDARPIVYIKEISNGLDIFNKKIVHSKSDSSVIEVDDFTLAYKINEDTQTWKAPSNLVCMVNGRQGLGSYTDGSWNKHATVDALYATEVGLKKFHDNMWLAHYYSYRDTWIAERTVDLLLFQGR